MLFRGIIFFTVVNLVAGYTACDIKDLGTTATAHFYGRVNTTMENPIETIEGTSKYTCVQTCRKNPSCLAFSYEVSSSSCKLYEYDSESADTSLTPAPGVWFYDMQNIAENAMQSYVGRCTQGYQCHNGGSCQNDCSQSGYFCACTELYHGQYCQDEFIHEPVLVQTIIGDASQCSIGFDYMNVHYLVIGAYRDGALTKVYKYNRDTGLYEYFVSLSSTMNVKGMNAFNINGRMFLFVANHYESTHTTTSQLFVINDDTGEFAIHQTFTTYGPTSVSYLKANDGNKYLLVANHYLTSYSVNSVVYHWSDDTEEFSQIALLPTTGAYFSTLFEINGQIFAAMANYHYTSYDVLSVIYKMESPGSWSVIQSLPESSGGGLSLKSFETDMGIFLVLIKHYLCAQSAVVYRWNPVSEQFEIHQKIPMINCPTDSIIFKIGREVFMITSSLRTAWTDGSYSVQNIIYKLEGTMFVEHSSLPAREVWSWSSFERDGEHYLAQANNRHETNDDHYDTSFKIYKWT
ncbi:thrombospondin-type laminin G domain and EAR repeat-containing protein-like [Anneissia japonica]|uniref:thrombospondin-type laminin G domain and EAR repeat-containing protein-like n=1 Tax=Anneissia japonica TaxID=1529436 RepID=UPI00142596F5|nr:thrombospondin-type laminin G domain and EAR repeat-containing protein-like [Anneissia japonica]